MILLQCLKQILGLNILTTFINPQNRKFPMPSKTSLSSQPKYRPAFTLEQITHIANVLQSDMEDETSKSIVRILVPLLAKISNEIIQPAYTLAPPKIEEKLVNRPTAQSEQYRYENDLMSPQEQETYEAKILGLL